MASLFAGFVFLAPVTFAFAQVEGAHDDSIVPAFPASAVAGDEVVLLEELLPPIAGELGLQCLRHFPDILLIYFSNL
jgi:hypothetical protein